MILLSITNKVTVIHIDASKQYPPLHLPGIPLISTKNRDGFVFIIIQSQDKLCKNAEAIKVPLKA